MKTTEIFVEQLLIGFLVIFILVMFGFYDADLLAEWRAVLRELETASKIGLAAVLVGAAYWIGIIYDRCADTILKDFDQHGRLQVGLDGETLNEFFNTYDPFPEDTIRLLVQTDSGVAEWGEYLKTRIRLTRSLATLVPALATVLLLVVVNSEPFWLFGAVYVGSIYGYVFLAKAAGWTPEPPKTYLDKKAHEALRDYVKSHNKNKRGRIDLSLEPSDFMDDIAFVGLLGLTILNLLHAGAAAAEAVSGPGLEVLLIPAAGFGLTVLVWWCWWRINRTFFLYLKSIQKNPRLLDPQRLTNLAQKRPRKTTSRR